MPSIYLVGFMASGKSRVGASLAGRMGRRFLDLDTVVEQRLGATIRDIFATRGETAFRAAETAALRWTTTLGEAVVATGGGTFCSERNREVIRRSLALSVFLDVPWPTIVARLSGNSSDRPMFGSSSEARRLLEARRKHYEEADVAVRLTGAEAPEAVADQVLELLAEAACAT